jgi:hypothetical protein
MAQQLTLTVWLVHVLLQKHKQCIWALQETKTGLPTRQKATLVVCSFCRTHCMQSNTTHGRMPFLAISQTPMPATRQFE